MKYNKCYICGDAAVSKRERSKNQTVVNCNRCGAYYYKDNTKAYIEQVGESKFKSCAYYYFTHIAKRDKPYQIYHNQDIDTKGVYKVSVDEILNLYPKTISKKIDMALLNLAKLSNGLGNQIMVSSEESFCHILFADNGIELKYIYDTMNAMDLINKPGSWGFSNPIQFMIRYKGWQRIDELQKQNAKHKKGFIAMWFDEKMDSTRSAIKEVFIETGYQISIIDEKQHNNQIVPEILYEIETSDFIVADLTGNRNGVYYEAGYALGQGKEVILSIDKNEIDGDYDNAPHFDVAQINQIRYENSDDLKVQLFNRITATVGNLKDPNAKLKKYTPKGVEVEVGKND